jgi:Ser/Thr protein kinase RdoA (MazF antagonist)
MKMGPGTRWRNGCTLCAMSEQTSADRIEQFSNVAARYFPASISITKVEGSDSLARVETATGAFVLRRWPSGTTPERIKFVHSVVSSLSELPFVPKLARAGQETAIQVDQYLFDAITWLDGKPLRRPEWPARLESPVSLPRPGSVELIEELTAAVAKMHVATKELAEKRTSPKSPMNALIASVRDAWMQQRGRLRPIAHLTPDIQRWLRTGERALPLAERIIAGLPEDAVADFVVAHANLWPEHVLIEREGRVDRLAGLLDFKSVVATTPLLDLAQVAGRFNGWSDETAEIVIGAYSETGRLTPPERRVVPAVAAFDLVAETGRILVTTYAELGSPNAPESMRDAANTMLRSLETATRTMERLEGINVPGPRKWVHRAPRQGKAPKSETRAPQRKKKPPRKPRTTA